MPAERPSLDDLLSRVDVRRLRDVYAGRTDVVVVITTTSGEMLWGSGPGSTHLFGRSSEQYVGEMAQQYVHPDDRRNVEAVFAEAAASGATKSYRCRAAAEDGSWVPMRTVTWRVHARDGTPALVHVATTAAAPPVPPPS